MRLLLPLLAAAAALLPLGAAAQGTPGGARALHQPGLLLLPAGGRAPHRARRPRRGDRAGAARRLLGLSRLEGRLRPARQHRPPARLRQGGAQPVDLHPGDGRAGRGAGEGPRRRRASWRRSPRTGQRPPEAELDAGARRRHALDPPRADRRPRPGRPTSTSCASCRPRRWRSRRGENAGRTVTYTNIVTDWETIAHWDGAAPLDMRYEGPATARWRSSSSGSTWGRC